MKKTNKLWLCLLLTALVAALFAVGFTAAAEETPVYAVGDQIRFGNYPQSRVDETPALRAAAETASWKSYGYYALPTDSRDYMQFADFLCDGVKYRAVAFCEYRWEGSTTSASSNTAPLSNGYRKNTIYYFKYEPLTWRVLDPATGFVLCESTIDAQAFFDGPYVQRPTHYGDPGICWHDESMTTYASEYETSTIRLWLNGIFFETSFTDEQKANIQVTELNNNSTVDSLYDAAPTNDKVFLLSYADAINPAYGFSSSPETMDANRKAEGTDYARCQGLNVVNGTPGTNYSWWLRTPEAYGDLNYVYRGALSKYEPYFNNPGVRPACHLSVLADDTAQDAYLFSANEEQGFCGAEDDGANLTWKRDRNTLTVSGTGEMKRLFRWPAVMYTSIVNHVVVEAGVTTLGRAFSEMQIKAIDIPQSVTGIAYSAFADCDALTDVFYAGSETQWGQIETEEENTPLLAARRHYNIVDWGYCGGEGDGTNLIWTLDRDGLLTISGEGEMGDTRWSDAVSQSTTGVVMEEGVTTVSVCAFADTHAKSIVVPASVTTIWNSAFINCSQLETLTILNPTQVLGTDRLNLPYFDDGLGPVFRFNVTLRGYLGSTTAALGQDGPDRWPFTALCPTDYTHNVIQKEAVSAACTEAGHTAGWYCTDCGAWLNGETVDPTNHPQAVQQEKVLPRAGFHEHGHEAGVWCADCGTWVSGGDVIHNQDGEQRIVKEATVNETGEVLIECTKCGEWGLYELPKLDPPADDDGGEETDNSFFGRVRRFAKSVVDWFLRLIRWMGKR